MSTRPSPLGALLRAKRRENRVGFKQLHAATGLEPETLRQWEVGKIAEPPLRGVLLYARAVGITLDELVEAALPNGAEPQTEQRARDDATPESATAARDLAASRATRARLPRTIRRPPSGGSR